MSGRARGARAGAVRSALSLAAGPYRAAMMLRRWAYRRGLLPRHQAWIPVISIGNITAGGTGKTPMVAWTVARLREMGHSPAVLIRGYKALDGRSDEAALLEQLCGPGPGGAQAVFVDADRLAGARAAAAAGADVCVMDDGFQHQRLRRALDIVLIDASEPWGLGHCLPRGLLREPPRALRDAGTIVVTRADTVKPAELAAIRSRLSELAPRAGLHAAIHKPAGLVDGAGKSVAPAALLDRPVLAFCGLGNPGAFFGTLAKLGAATAGELALEDHVVYTPEVLDRVRRLARDSHAEALVTTQKDMVKLAGADLGLPLWAIAVEIEIIDGAAALLERLRKAASTRAGTGR